MKHDRHEPCQFCGDTNLRPKFPAGFSTGSKKARRQHPSEWVCGRGHRQYRKTR